MFDTAARQRVSENTADAGDSTDGTWQRKDFSSTLQVMAAICSDSGKVLDVPNLSKSCKGWTNCLF